MRGAGDSGDRVSCAALYFAPLLEISPVLCDAESCLLRIEQGCELGDPAMNARLYCAFRNPQAVSNLAAI